MQENFENNSQNFAPIKSRILQFIECKGFDKTKFFNEIGLVKSNFSSKALESEVSASVVSKILNHYPGISPDWLLLGIGEMDRTDNLTRKKTDTTSNDSLLLKIEMLEKMVQEKDRTIDLLSQRFCEIENQLKTKDAQINSLLSILSGKDHVK